MTLPADSALPNEAADELQFDVVEPAQTAATSTAAAACAACKRPIASTYYAVGANVICADCAAQVNARPTGARSKRLGLATLYGIGAAIAGGIIWFAIRRITHLEIGYVAILVGVMVGGAVRKGSGNRGGRAYQFLAIALTYCSIAGNYAPDVIAGLLDGYHKNPATVAQDKPSDGGVAMSAPAKQEANAAGKDVSAVTDGNVAKTSKPAPSWGRAVLALAVLTVLVAALSLAAPFLAGFENVIGILIIAFALFQAWKMNRARRVPVTGPYQLGRPRVGGAV